MKKTILILAFIASISFAFGQATHNSFPRPLICTTGPLNPVAGVPYDYSANLNPELGTAYWFATTTTDFITNGSLTSDQEIVGGNYVADATNYQTSVPGATSPSTTTITWNSLGLAEATSGAVPLFVAIKYDAPPTGCADNFKVFRIDPVNAFMVNVMNTGGAYSTPVASCYDNVATATYDLNNNCMNYDYGVDTLAYEVVAANFTGSYTPSFRVDGIRPGQSVDVTWSYTNNSTTGIPLGTLAADGIVPGTLVTTALQNTADGVSIYVWLVVHNLTYEGLSNDPLTLAAAGLNAANEPNVRWDDCNVNVDLTAPLAASNGPDFGVHTLNARPDVTPAGGEVFETPCSK